MRGPPEDQSQGIGPCNPAVEDQKRRYRQQERMRQRHRRTHARRQVPRNKQQRREPGSHDGQAHGRFAQSELGGYPRIEHAQRDAVVGVTKREEKLSRGVVDDLMEGVPLVVDQHLIEPLVEAQPGAQGEQDGHHRQVLRASQRMGEWLYVS